MVRGVAWRRLVLVGIIDKVFSFQFILLHSKLECHCGKVEAIRNSAMFE